MSFLEQKENLSSDIVSQLTAYYGDYFPMELRFHLAAFFKDRLINVPVPNEHCPVFDIEARLFYDDFIAEVHKVANSMTKFNQMPAKMRLIVAAQSMKNFNPTQVYSHLINCMIFEQQLLRQPVSQQEDASSQMTNSVETLAQNVRQNGDATREWIQRSQKYLCEYPSMNDFDIPMEDEPGNHFGILSRAERKRLSDSRITLDANLMTAVEKMQELTNRLLDDLRKWKWNQKLYGNSLEVNGINLDKIQNCFEHLAEGLWTTREQIGSIQAQSNIDLQPCQSAMLELHNIATNTLVKLITGSLLVVDGPPQVIKSSAKFSATLRLLVGNVFNKFSKPAFKATMVPECNVVQGSHVDNTNYCEILNNNSCIEYSETTRHVTVAFRNMKLKKFRRPPKSTDSVVNDKFLLCFESNFAINEVQIKLREVSSPIVVIVNTSQEPQASATIFWDTYFTDPDRMSLAVPDQVDWKQFSEALNKKFFACFNRQLTTENLHFIAEKMFNETYRNSVPDEKVVSWTQFCKENIPTRSFTFWEWLHATIKLMSDHMSGPFKEGLITGYISKSKAEELLRGCRHGTFLLRFSDSESGCVSVAWSMNSNGTKGIQHIQPFKGKDLSTRSLCDRINDLDELKYLYPDIPKKRAFEKFMIQESFSGGRTYYVPTVMRLVIRPASPVVQ